MYCSFVLDVECRNVKALFRRGVSFARIGKIEDASVDLLRARDLEPKNKEILKELLEALDCMSLKGLGDSKGRESPMDICGIELSRTLGNHLPLPKSKEIDMRPSESKGKREGASSSKVFDPCEYFDCNTIGLGLPLQKEGCVRIPCSYEAKLCEL